MKTLFKILPFSMALLTYVFFVPQVQAQLHVDVQGEVGVGTSTPNSRLEIQAGASDRSLYLNNDYTGGNAKYGIYNQVNQNGTGNRYGFYNNIYSHTSSNAHYGIYNRNFFRNSGSAFGLYNYGYCDEGNGFRYGIYNVLECVDGCGSGSKYGLYSKVNNTCGNNSWAGYFNGNVYISGTLTQTSDASRKTNIQSLDNALGVISQLKAKTYDYLPDADLNLPEEKQYGFLAQDLEQILPEIVKEIDVISESPGDRAIETGSKGQIKSVNYQALFPILVKGIQEQQETIELLLERIEALEAQSDSQE